MKKYSDMLYRKYDLFWSRLIKKGYLFSNDSWHYSSAVPYREIGEFIQYIKNKNSGNRVLDIGVGNARNAIKFFQKKFQVWGIDISPSAIKFAHHNCSINHAKVELDVGDVLSLPYSKNYFDIIVDAGCLHHLRVSQWPTYIRNISTVLKSGGYIFLLTFSTKSKSVKKFGKRQNKYKNWSIRNGHYYHFFSRQEIIKLFGNDFKLIKCYDIQRSDSPIYFKISYLIKK